MKKLIALLIILALCLSSCDIISGIVGDDTPQGGSSSGAGNTLGDCSAGAHADEDDDGTCDFCAQSVIVIVDLYALNDIHGKITSTSSQPGIGGLTTYLKNAGDNSVVLSSGDMWQGTAESNLTYGAFITEWMNEVGVVSMTIGNHEYDWNESYISQNEDLASFPLLGINIYDKTTGQRAEYATPSIVIERGGVEIGIIGAIGDCYSSISGDVSGNFTFKVGSALTALVKAEAQRLRDAGVDFIVYSIHDGYGSGSNSTKYVPDSDIASYYDASLSDGYVDLVFEAHTHQSYILTDSHGVYHMQAGGENKGISHAVASINAANGNSRVTTAEIVRSSVYSSMAKDPVVDELLLKYDDVISLANEKLGTNKKYLDDSVVEQIVADLYYEFGMELWGDQYDIVLGGGFIRTRTPYNLKSGEIIYADVYSLLPFDNNIVLCAISGKDLYNKFLTTTNDDYYICTGDGVEELKNNIDYSKTYYIVTDTYTSSYRYNNCTEVARCTDRIFARDLFAQFIREGRLS